MSDQPTPEELKALGIVELDPTESAMYDDAPGAGTLPSTPASRDSWLQRTGDRAARKVQDTLVSELERLRGSPVRSFAEHTLLPVKAAMPVIEYGEEWRTGKAPEDYMKLLESIPDTARLAFEDPPEFLSGAVVGAVDDLAGMGARGRVRGENFLGDSLQMLGHAAPLARTVKSPMIGPKPPGKAKNYAGALSNAREARHEMARLQPEIDDAALKLDQAKRDFGYDEAVRSADDAKTRADLAEMERKVMRAEHDDLARQSTAAREVDNPARQRMRGAQGRSVDLERQLNAAVDDAFGSGQLSRQQKIALYDALQGKRLPDDLPPDLLDLAERLRESRIDSDRFRAASLTDEVRDPMSQVGLEKSGVRGAEVKADKSRALLDKQKAALGKRSAAEAKIDPLQKHLDELKSQATPLEQSEIGLKRAAASFDMDPVRWLARQPSEGLLASKIGPTQMRAAAWLVRTMADTHPIMASKAMASSSASGMTLDLARSILESHETLLSSDQEYAARFYEAAPQ